MGYKEISIKLPPGYSEGLLRKKVKKKLKIKEFSCQIARKSLDARIKSDIYWRVSVSVASKEIAGPTPVKAPSLNIAYRKRKKKVVVVGSGPAGFFSAFVLAKAGFNTTLIERGSDVKKRAAAIKKFEQAGSFDPINNYAFGEGGAGTFSDGKLTSRSKHISQERKFIFSTYIDAGAPGEIEYLAYPHLGSDNLSKITAKLREDFLNIGGKVLFETLLEDINIENETAREAITSRGPIEADEFIIAPGHAAYETYRMLIKRGVKFRLKSFALGCRVEHPQEVINNAQWGRADLPGVKAAQYRLTSNGDGSFPVYTFCMCPGGSIVPSSAYKNTNVVNGMSQYARDGKFANAACVAGIDLDKLIGKQTSPLQALAWLEGLERRFYACSSSFKAAFCSIRDFISQKTGSSIVESSYLPGLEPAALWDLLPAQVSSAIREGLKDFNKKIKGFEAGIIMGLDSKSSSPIQVSREEDQRCTGFANLYLAGEASGYSGGIVSSGADGIKAALAIIGKH